MNENLTPEAKKILVNVSGLQEVLLRPSWAGLLRKLLGYDDRDLELEAGMLPTPITLIGPSTQPTFRTCPETANPTKVFIGHRTEILTNRKYNIGNLEMRPQYAGYAQALNEGSPEEIFSVGDNYDYGRPRLALYRPMDGGDTRIEYNMYGDYFITYTINLETSELVKVVLKAGDKQREPDNLDVSSEQIKGISELYRDVFSFEPLTS